MPCGRSIIDQLRDAHIPGPNAGQEKFNSRPVVPTIFRKKPFGENVEGVSRCGDQELQFDERVQPARRNGQLSEENRRNSFLCWKIRGSNPVPSFAVGGRWLRSLNSPLN